MRKLHEEGVTGKGIGIGIIDQTILASREVIKDRLRYYGELGDRDNSATMHGSAVSSIAAGKTVGVAPEADLYYIATTMGTFVDNGFVLDFSYCR